MRDIGIRKEGNLAIIDVIEELEFGNAEQFDDLVKSLIKEGVNKIVVNFAKANYIDSAGLAVLISTLQSIKQAQGDLRLCALDENLKDVLNMTRLINYFKIFKDEKEALESFGG